MIYSKVEGYEAAGNKTAKSSIIFQTLRLIKRASPETGGFVKQNPKTKRWYAVDDSSARTTTAQAFRDALSSVYRSSKRAKQQRRWNRKTGDDNDGDDDEGEEEALVGTHEDQNSEAVGRLGLSDVLDMALGMAGEMMPLLPVSTGNCNFVPIAPRPQEIPSWEHQEALHRTPYMLIEAPQPTLDFVAIWNTLGLQDDEMENPFEPTPISPFLARDKNEAPLTSGGADLNMLKEADTFRAPSLYANTAATAVLACAPGGLSLRQALLSSVHHHY